MRLQVFKSRRRGWGVRTLEALRRASFVCEYAGELLSVSEAQERRAAATRGVNYLMVVNEALHRGGAAAWRTAIDPSAAGNVGRYLNHSCRPNLRHALVRAGSWVPRVAFFCARDIAAGEELTFFYGEPAGSGAGAASEPNRAGALSHRSPCLCGEATCHGFLPCDPEC